MWEKGERNLPQGDKLRRWTVAKRKKVSCCLRTSQINRRLQLVKTEGREEGGEGEENAEKGRRKEEEETDLTCTA